MATLWIPELCVKGLGSWHRERFAVNAAVVAHALTWSGLKSLSFSQSRSGHCRAFSGGRCLKGERQPRAELWPRLFFPLVWFRTYPSDPGKLGKWAKSASDQRWPRLSVLLARSQQAAGPWKTECLECGPEPGAVLGSFRIKSQDIPEPELED